MDTPIGGLLLVQVALIAINAFFAAAEIAVVSLSETKLDRVAFEACPMRESLWVNVKLGRVRFSESDLAQSEWSYTPLKGQDLSSCRIEGLRIALPDLSGLRLTSAQLAALSGLLGVVLTD